MSAQLTSASSGEQLDAITLIENDHRVVEGLFGTYEGLGPDGNVPERQRTVHSMIEELRLHAAMEEQVFYPAVQEALGDEADELVEESLREHAEAKQTLDELDALEPSAETFHQRVTELIEEVRHHVDEEEQEILPKLRAALDSQVLLQLGEELEGSKMTLLGVAVTAEAPQPAGSFPEEGLVIGDAEAPAAEQLERLADPADRSGQTSRPPAKRATTAKTKSSPKRTSAKKKTSAKRGTTAKTKSSPKRTSAKKKTSATRGATAKTKTSAKKTSVRSSSRNTKRLVYHVKPTGSGRWAVALQGAARPSATFDRKTEAVARGRELARRRERGRLVVHDRDGRIQDQFTYGDALGRTRG
jgi:iron-sulfur cluster repair protein YtfE (RIC family)